MSKFLDSNGLQYFWQKIKNAIRQCMITDTASGVIASFPDGAAMPIESLTVDLEPIQDLHGYDSPWPAGGGKNLYNKDGKNTGNGYISGKYLISSGITNSNPAWDISEYIPVSANTQYTLSNVNGSNPSIAYYDSNKTLLSSEAYSGVSPKTITTPANTAYVRLSVTVATEDTVQFESGASATSYAPYSNICPITGRESVTVTRTGKNLLPNTGESKTTAGVTWTKNADGAITVSGTATGYSDFEIGYAKVTPDMGTITLSGIGGTTNVNWGYITLKDANNESIVNLSTGSASASLTFDISGYPNADTIKVAVKRGNNNVATSGVIKPQLELGSTASAYEPYDGQSATIQLGTTVYGGTVDVTTGVMTVTHAIVDLGNTNWVVPSTTTTPFRTQAVSTLPMFNGIIPKFNENFICTMYPSAGIKAYNTVPDGAIAFTNGSVYNPGGNMIRIHDSSKVGMTAAEFKAYISGTMLCYELLEPQTIQLTPAQLTTLKGQNNVWSDADSVTVDYVADPKLYIARLTEPDADMVADVNIVNGKYFMVGNTLYLATANIASGATIVPGVNCTRTNLASALNAINA